jgi:hydrogenase maturation protein HypF
MISHELNAPLTSSVGRLFDVVASIIGLRQKVHFEGQAAMELEFTVAEDESDETYPIAMTNRSVADDRNITEKIIRIDWEPILRAILDNMYKGISEGVISARFHKTLGEIIVQIAEWAALERVILTGGCFQNKYLTEYAVRRLRKEGFHPYWHQRVPPNDGGIALGQAAVAAYSTQRGKDNVPSGSGGNNQHRR